MKRHTLFLFVILLSGSIFSAPPAPVPATGQTTSYQVGDDGNIQPGVAWPDPRFTDNGDGTATDNLTGLEWIKNPQGVSGNNSKHGWSDAITFCQTLNYGGHTDWRLPNAKELESLIHCGKGPWGSRPFEWLNSNETPFSGIRTEYYWTSTTHSRTSIALRFIFSDGTISGTSKSATCFVWPVRTR